ncbi:MAG TPA: YceI family protein [Gemmatimonadaceae bacterium]
MTRATVGSVALLALIATGVGAQDLARVPVSPDSKLWIEGTSNLHGWTCRAQELNATVELDAAAAAELTAAPPKALKRVTLKVPVKALKCGHGAMDNNLYKALNADATPDISYIMATFEAVPGETRDSFSLKTVGTLTVAGAERSITMEVRATRLADGTVTATGVVPIRMTDFGIKPPTAIFGRLKTGDEVKVNFELTMGARAIAAAAGK